VYVPNAICAKYFSSKVQLPEKCAPANTHQPFPNLLSSILLSDSEIFVGGLLSVNFDRLIIIWLFICSSSASRCSKTGTMIFGPSSIFALLALGFDVFIDVLESELLLLDSWRSDASLALESLLSFCAALLVDVEVSSAIIACDVACLNIMFTNRIVACDGVQSMCLAWPDVKCTNRLLKLTVPRISFLDNLPVIP